jgi:Ca2+-binding RTX toxin-like protein
VPVGVTRGRRLLGLSAGLAVATALTLFAAGAGKGQSGPTCFGREATIVGTDGPDVLTGTPGTDVIVGLGGDDRIDAGAGDDFVCGGDGNDTILGGDGTDVLFGDAGDDTVDAGPGYIDAVAGGPGSDHLIGNQFSVVNYVFAPGPETVDLSTGTASGAEGNDTLTGFVNIFGSYFPDTLIGNAAGNAIFGIAGDDVIRGGPGFDIVGFSLNSTVTVNLAAGTSAGGATDGNDTLSGMEGAFTGNGNDTLIGDGQNNFLSGNDGNDTISGGGGADTILGGAGDDNLSGGNGNDFLQGDEGTNLVDGGAGANDLVTYAWMPGPDGITVDLGAGTAQGDQVSDTLRNVESVSGSNLPDDLRGNDQANALYGSGGDDKLAGLAGNDFLSGGPGTDSGDAGAGSDYCLDTEAVSSCETSASSPARRVEAAAAAAPRLSRLLGGLCAGGRCLPAVPRPLAAVPLATRAGTPLDALVQSYTQPTCKPLRRGGGVATIAPPQVIKQPGGYGIARWQATLYRKGKKKPVAPATPLAEGTLIGPAQAPGQPPAWMTTKGHKIVGTIAKRMKRPGIYYWKVTVSLVKSGPTSTGTLRQYYQPPGTPSVAPRPYCDFRRR